MNNLSVPFPFLIRAARQHDLGGLSDVLANSFHTQDGLMGWFYPLLRMGIYEDLRNRLRSKALHQVCLVAIAPQGSPPDGDPPLKGALSTHTTDALAGTVEIGLRSQNPWYSRTHRYLYISNLAVRQEYRRQGVALHLLIACERIALDWGYRDIYLHVLEHNHAARRLYHKAGYQLQEVELTIGAWLLGRSRQLLLHKRLKGG